jgi:probable HAF family extracellular repeat protein
MTDLGTLRGTVGLAPGINALGHDLGTLGGSHAFVWGNDVMTDLGTPGGISHARAVNRAGWVVGGSEAKSGDVHAMLWKPNSPTLKWEG